MALVAWRAWGKAGGRGLYVVASPSSTPRSIEVQIFNLPLLTLYVCVELS